MHRRNPVIYFRPQDPNDEELYAARNYFHVVTNRTLINPNSLVIPRYSFLPFPQELSEDVYNLDSKLINSVEQHRYVADLRRYVKDLEGITPRTWTTWNDLPEGMSFVVKGVTNSRKFEWNTRMFAQTREDVPRVANSLLDDVMIKDQGIVVREYVPLKKFGEGINGLPVTNEWRFFVLDDKILDAGYYWASEPDTAPGELPPLGAFMLVKEVIRRLEGKIRFYVVDVAERASGGWIVIELNDGCMSGLSMIDPSRFYKTLAKVLF